MGSFISEGVEIFQYYSEVGSRSIWSGGGGGGGPFWGGAHFFFRVSLITGLLITGLDWTGILKFCLYALW